LPLILICLGLFIMSHSSKTALASAILAVLLSACGDNTVPESASTTAAADTEVTAAQDGDYAAKATIAPTALERDAIVLLVPTGSDTSTWPVKVWADTALDEGYRLQILSSADFLAMGSTTSTKIRALIMPDSAFVSASDAVVTAVNQYVTGGGNLMLVYDAGMLTDTNFYAPGQSRFSSLAGVNYGMYDTLADRLVGIGGIVATEQRLQTLGFPPGKSIAYNGTSTLIGQLKGTNTDASSARNTTLRYLPADTSDPGGLKRATNYTRARPGAIAAETSHGLQGPRGPATQPSVVLRTPDQSAFRLAAPVSERTGALDSLSRRLDPDELDDLLGNGTSQPGKAVPVPVAGPSTAAHMVSGYNYSKLDYYSFVTTGTYNGTLLVASPDFGVVSGLRAQGTGKVLFVNIPLGYFKAIGTDSTPIHGFLNYFGGTVAGLTKVSSQAKGVGAMIYNWHVDDGDDLTVDAKTLLDNGKVFNRGPFSVHFTAGPDTVVAGDALGMNLNNNLTARNLVKRIGNIGVLINRLPVTHELASHGGWNHDIYGLGVTENNSATYLPYLQNNFNAVGAVTGRTQTEYSAPQGNNPIWALNWLQSQGVVGYYYVGDVGAAAVRAYRDGILQHPNMWAFPVNVFGTMATFEEFDENGVSDTSSREWLYKMQDFVANRRTNRMFYNHPPGALAHETGVVIPMLDRADALKSQGKFQWVTMTQQAQFQTRRNAAVWKVSSNGARVSTFTATHASSLQDITWLIPKARYGQPRVTSGSATITSDTLNWVVTAGGVRSLTLTASEL
jgi:hypothetical protein